MEPDQMTDPPINPPARALSREPSLILVNTGDGKGKSTAAFGTALRAVARGWKVGVVQFLSRGNGMSARRRSDAAWGWTGGPWVTASRGLGGHRGVGSDRQRGVEGGPGTDRVRGLRLTHPRRDHVSPELGVDRHWRGDRGHQSPTTTSEPGADRGDTPERLVEVADTVTEMKKVKHAFDRGVMARRGIDY